ncbi:hypothetical protein ACJMK2_024869, partial [Sinanodonta woodiana]
YSKPEIYNHGDNATVLFEKLQTDEIKSLEIVFSGFTKRLHVVHVIILGPNLNNDDYIKVNRHYIGRIKDINMNNDSLSFLLLNANFMDSGNYTVVEGSLVKGKRGILVTRRILTGHGSKPMILPFVCNNTNTSSITIGHSYDFDYMNYIVYDVVHNNCTYTNVSQNYTDRIDSCVINDTNFNLVIRELTWQDKGYYTAWDDQGLLLDSIFVGIAGDENVYNFEEKLIWLLVSATVNVHLLVCLAVIAVQKLRHRKGRQTKEEITCSDPNENMFQATNAALQRDDDDERIYGEPRCHGMELTAYMEPNSQPVNVHQQLHPYGNQGNNIYRSARSENII